MWRILNMQTSPYEAQLYGKNVSNNVKDEVKCIVNMRDLRLDETKDKTDIMQVEKATKTTETVYGTRETRS